MTDRSATRSMLALVVLAVAALALSACSGSVSVGDSNAPQAVTTAASASPGTYTNDEYAFSLTHDPSLIQGEPTAGTGTKADFEVIFADQNGAQAGGSYLDVVDVSVFKLARALKAAQVPKLASEVEAVATDMVKTLDGAKVTAPLSELKVNGLPGFVFNYTYKSDGTPVTAAAIFLFKGDREYLITTQAATENWDQIQGKLKQAVMSFKAK